MNRAFKNKILHFEALFWSVLDIGEKAFFDEASFEKAGSFPRCGPSLGRHFRAQSFTKLDTFFFLYIIFFFVTVVFCIFSPDMILCGWLGLKYQQTICLFVSVNKQVSEEKSERRFILSNQKRRLIACVLWFIHFYFRKYDAPLKNNNNNNNEEVKLTG